jgi:2-polyprenyl-3-methyl-5-hydroxy-6-metoxy-1,4-benzoquinol methylase
MKLFSRLKKQTNLLTKQLPNSSGLPQPTFEALLPKTPELRNQFIEYVKIVNDTGGLYHQLDFGNGIVINGLYNMARYILFLDLPINLEGKTILDIGTSSGYFALECARRGGRVTAIDIYENQFFDVLLSLADISITYVNKSIYEISEEFGQFDVVVCGSLLLHLPDVVGALRKVRSVCKGQAIISTACPEDSMINVHPVCEFLGQKGEDGDYWTYWNIGAIALKNMLITAGFVHAINARHFTLISEPGYRTHANPHVVMTGLV